MIGNGVMVYLDDILVYNKNYKDHIELVDEVVRLIGKNKFKVGETKIQYCQNEVEVLGIRIDGQSHSPLEKHKEKIKLMESPKSIKEVQAFLGTAGWFRGHIKDYLIKTAKITDGLRNKSNFKCYDAMEKEFEQIKNEIKNTKGMGILDYKKEMILRTDASNIGIGAVLLQKTEKGEYRPIVYASKKLTPTEKRYGISEKEMLAIKWGIRKFEYELRGRKFTLETDHKALEEIRNKPNFDNNRINRWIEQIQEFDFDVRYVKGEKMGLADQLSREQEDEGIKTLKGQKMKITKQKNHTKIINGKEMWQFDSGEVKEIPSKEERESIIIGAHEKIIHRSKEYVYHEIKKKFYWQNMKKQIEEVLKNCDIWKKMNRKKNHGSEFIVTTRPFEMVGIDMIDVREEGKYVVTAIDYFTRFICAEVLGNKKAETVIGIIKNWCKDGYIPEKIISDNGKEFVNDKFRIFANQMGIEHIKVGVESHRSNGRIERVIGTIREGIRKFGFKK